MEVLVAQNHHQHLVLSVKQYVFLLLVFIVISFTRLSALEVKDHSLSILCLSVPTLNAQ